LTFPLVMVEFYDSTHDPGWKGEEEDFRGCAVCKAVGWRVQMDRKCVVLAMMRSDGGCCSERMIIPRGAIIKTTPLDSHPTEGR